MRELPGSAAGAAPGGSSAAKAIAVRLLCRNIVRVSSGYGSDGREWQNVSP